MAREVAKEEVINATLAALHFVKKPKPQAKHLATPPFRYIYDTVVAVINETGFPKGLYSAEQMAFPNNVAKEEKVKFLDRLICCLSIATGNALEARPQKICAGMEPDKTNVMLQELGKCAENRALDLPSILAQVNAQLGPPEGTAAAPASTATAAAPADNSAVEAEAKARAEAEAAAAAAAAKKAKDEAAAAAAAAKAEEEKKRARAEAIAKAQAAAEAKAAADAKAAAEAAAAASAAAAAATTGGGGDGDLRFDRAAIALDEPTTEGFAEATMLLYSKLITKPKLAVKLLERPPFRFIQDIVISVHQRTGFGAGVFSEADLTTDKDNKTDSSQKVQWLKKLIDLVSVARGRDLNADVKPRKIAAGQEADKTNLLLQELARAAASGVNADDVARKYAARSKLGGDEDGNTTAAAPASNAAAEAAAREKAEKAAADKAAAEAAAAEAAAAKKRESEATLAAAKKKLADDKRRAAEEEEERAKSQAAMPRLPLGDLNDTKKPAPGGADDGDDKAAGGAGDAADKKRPERPKTARRAPPRVKDAHLISDDKKQPNTTQIDDNKTDANGNGTGAAADGKANAPAAAPAAGVIREDDKGAADEPESDGEEEAAAEAPLWKEAGGKDGKSGENMGKLMREIDAAKKAAAGGNGAMTMRGAAGSKVGAAANANANNKLMSAEQLAVLRAAVQRICQSANPLGKCIDFVSEDMDQMDKELTRWKRAYTQYNEKYESEKAETASLLAPLQAQIKAADMALQNQLRKIQTVKAAILRNDATIATAIEQHATTA